MRQSYNSYDSDELFFRTFMTPAVMPDNDFDMNFNNMNTQNNKFLNSKETFLRGNIEAGTYIPYKNYTYLEPNLTNEKQKALYKIQELCFAAHELNLYLDTHPNDSNALKLYNDYNKKSKELTLEYERKYGPIDLSDDEGLSMTPWSWINEPWPWNR